MSDMKFDQETLRVPEGAIVHLTLVNKSKAAGMLHNFVLVEFGKTANVALLAINAKDQDYVPKHAAIIAASPMARPGETVEVEFQAPPKGNYQFICSYPGHAMSMRGLFIVE